MNHDELVSSTAALMILLANHECHLHSDPSVTEGVCCICDAEAPCDYALEEL